MNLAAAATAAALGYMLYRQYRRPSPSKIILWGSVKSRTTRAIWILEALELPYVHNKIAVRTKEADDPQFMAISPRKKVPVLEDGDFVLTESVVIMTYLCDKYGGGRRLLPPPNTRERAVHDSWCSTIQTELDAQGLYMHRKHIELPAVYGDAPVAVEAARVYFFKQLESIRVAVECSPTTSILGAGWDFTVADALLTLTLLWANEVGWLALRDDTVFGKYAKAHMLKPSFAALQQQRPEWGLSW